MPPFRSIDLRFPSLGLSKQFAVQQQAPFTSASMSNVRPDATIEGRERGGSRPGLVKTFAQRIGTGNPIYMAEMMRSLSSEGRSVFSEDFESVSEWTDMGTSWAKDGGLTINEGQVRVGVDVVNTTDVGSVLNAAQLVNIKDSDGIISAQYTIEVYLPSQTINPGATVVYYVYAALDDIVPSQNKNVMMRLIVSGGGVPSYSFSLGVDGLPVVDTSIPVRRSSSSYGDIWISLTIDSTLATAKLIPGPLSTFFQRELTLIIDAPVKNHSRVGFRVDNNSLQEARADDFRVRFIDSTGGVPPEAMVVASQHSGTAGKQGANIWYETNSGIMTEAPSDRGGTASTETTDLAAGVFLAAVDRLGKLYIADHGTRKTASDGKLSADGLTFDDAADTDWSEATATVGVDPDGDWLEILSTGTEGKAVLGVYKITAASASGVTISTSANDGQTAGNAIRYRIVRGAKIFDPAAATGSKLTRWEAESNKGSVPLGCTMIQAFKDRIVMGGDPENPSVWYMSRQSKPNDWLFGDTDAAAAVAGTSVTSEAGLLANPLSAIASVGRDYMYLSAESELYLMVGDPMQGGTLDNISRQIGIGSRTAFARTPDGGIVFLSRDGFYGILPGAQAPQPISADRLPRQLLGLVQNTSNNVLMEFDVREQGVHIYITPDTAGPTTHWWYDWKTKGLFPTTLDSDYQPFSVVFDAKSNKVILGCRDGYLRHFDNASSDDDGLEFSSHVLYGPFLLGGTIFNGNVAELNVVLDDDSGDVDWDVLVGDSAQSAFSSTPFDSGTTSAGRNGTFRPRAGGHSAYLRLSNNKNERWAVESVSLALERTGRTRIA